MVDATLRIAPVALRSAPQNRGSPPPARRDCPTARGSRRSPPQHGGFAKTDLCRVHQREAPASWRAEGEHTSKPIAVPQGPQLPPESARPPIAQPGPWSGSPAPRSRRRVLADRRPTLRIAPTGAQDRPSVGAATLRVHRLRILVDSPARTARRRSCARWRTGIVSARRPPAGDPCASLLAEGELTLDRSATGAGRAVEGIQIAGRVGIHPRRTRRFWGSPPASARRKKQSYPPSLGHSIRKHRAGFSSDLR